MKADKEKATAKSQPKPNSTAAPNPTLTSSEMLALIQDGGRVRDDQPPPPPHEEERTPITIDSLAADIRGLSRQLESQEDQLVSISDGIGSLDEKVYEVLEAVSKLPTRSMIEALSKKVDEILEKSNEGGASIDHIEWPNERWEQV